MSRHLEAAMLQVLTEEVVADPKVSEISLNEDGTVWVERSGSHGMIPLETTVSGANGLQLGRDLAGKNGLSATNPLAGTQFELFESLWRSQVVIPPAIENGVVFSLRRSVNTDFSLDDLVSSTGGRLDMQEVRDGADETDRAVFAAYNSDDFAAFLKAAVAAKWNILLSGGTSSGKTTWLRAALSCADPAERILTIEDVREIRPKHKNRVELIANERASSGVLLKAALRLRPDRILMGEIRGAEAFEFLSAINSGHPGGMTTLHAANVDATLPRLALMVMQANTGLTYSEILEYCETMIDVVISFKKAGNARVPSGIRVLRHRPSAMAKPTS